MPAAVAECPRERSATCTLVRGTPEYPAALLDLADPPATLHVRGAPAALAARSVAIVGARAASPYGRALAERLARDLAALGVVVVSGLARGIDAAAHQGALAVGGRSVGILPCGIDRVVPADHAALAATMSEAGALASEQADGPPFGRGAFVRRNRLIAALAQATVVVEATEDSGALSTAAVARALGRPLLASPADVDRPTARGTLGLLRTGARIAADAGDVMAVLEGLPAAPRAAADAGAAHEADAGDGMARLLAALATDASALEPLAARARLAIPEAQALLLQLEWSGLAIREPGQRWRRR